MRRLAPLSLVNFAEILECFNERNCHSRLVEILYENGERPGGYLEEMRFISERNKWFYA